VECVCPCSRKGRGVRKKAIRNLPGGHTPPIVWKKGVGGGGGLTKSEPQNATPQAVDYLMSGQGEGDNGSVVSKRIIIYTTPKPPTHTKTKPPTNKQKTKTPNQKKIGQHLLTGMGGLLIKTRKNGRRILRCRGREVVKLNMKVKE